MTAQKIAAEFIELAPDDDCDRMDFLLDCSERFTANAQGYRIQGMNHDARVSDAVASRLAEAAAELLATCGSQRAAQIGEAMRAERRAYEPGAREPVTMTAPASRPADRGPARRRPRRSRAHRPRRTRATASAGDDPPGPQPARCEKCKATARWVTILPGLHVEPDRVAVTCWRHTPRVLSAYQFELVSWPRLRWHLLAVKTHGHVAVELADVAIFRAQKRAER